MNRLVVKNGLSLAAILLGSILVSTTGFSQNKKSVQQSSASVAKSGSAKSSTATSSKKATQGTTASNLGVLGAGGSKLRLQGTLSHVPKLRNDQEDTTDFLVRGDYRLNKNNIIRVQQSWTKFYSKYESEYEFRATDTHISHNYLFSKKPAGVNMALRTAFAVPISNNSNRDDLYTRITSSFLANKMFLNNRLFAMVIPYARYHFYEYRTSVSGRPLPWYTVGLTAIASYSVTSKLSAAFITGYSFEGMRSSQYETNPEQLNNGGYRFDFDISYQILKSLSASVGYSQGASYMQDGRYELVVYDDQNSRYYLGMTYVF